MLPGMALCCLLLLSCVESLPPLIEPDNLLEGSLVPSYTYGEDNMLTVQFLVTNEFDETLEGTASFSGEIEIMLERLPQYKRTIALSPSNIFQARDYDPTTRMLRMDAGESIWLQVKWNFVDDDGRDLRTGIFQYVPDPTCPQTGGRRIAMSERFVIRGRLLLFDRTGDVRVGPVVFSFCHIDSWVLPRDCPPISPSLACDLIQ